MYNFDYKKEFGDLTGMQEEDRADTGVIAQELSEVLPDAVRESGDIILPGGDLVDKIRVVNKVSLV